MTMNNGPASQDSGDLLDKVLSRLAGSLPDSQEDGLYLRNQGQISSMQLPDAWLEGDSRQGRPGTAQFRQFNPPSKPEVAICFYYRGRGMSAAASQSFHNLLALPAHTLTDAELCDARELLGDKNAARSFTLKRARSEEFNGKMVLVAEGRYEELKEDTLCLFVDADPAENPGRFVQEVYFQAPLDDYAEYFEEATASLKSIVWK
jgi:hypothetical protein